MDSAINYIISCNHTWLYSYHYFPYLDISLLSCVQQSKNHTTSLSTRIRVIRCLSFGRNIPKNKLPSYRRWQGDPGDMGYAWAKIFLLDLHLQESLVMFCNTVYFSWICFLDETHSDLRQIFTSLKFSSHRWIYIMSVNHKYHPFGIQIWDSYFHLTFFSNSLFQ